MKDVCGNELKVGDIVLTTNYPKSNLNKARVIGFTDKKIRVHYLDVFRYNWYKKAYEDLILTKFPYQVSKQFVESPFDKSIEKLNSLGLSKSEIDDVIEEFKDLVNRMDY